MTDSACCDYRWGACWTRSAGDRSIIMACPRLRWCLPTILAGTGNAGSKESEFVNGI